MGDVVAAIVALTNWKVDYILHGISYPQLLLVANRYPRYGSQPETKGNKSASTGALKKFGGEIG
ncbi:MAG: hypothetical protein IIB39_06575 [Candidatus Marinimicrobia bacterium]|nr:hypothetical protein [Candidatus Neomarinimicrobiota bacterium]